MRSFARPSFFRLFDLLLSTTNPGLKLSRWTFDGVEFERERHSFMGPKHGVAIEIFTLTRAGRRGWTLLVTKEYWWVGEESKALKNLRWARPTSGQRSDVLSWLRVQESALERSLSVARISDRPTMQFGTTANDGHDEDVHQETDESDDVSKLNKRPK
jgi:hypothetical protein